MTDSFANRNSKFAVRLVRHSKFVIRHCPHPHDATGRFDFVLANPPFNVNAVDTAMRVSARRHSEGTPQDLPARQDHERLKDMVGPARRFPFGLPRTDNGNYLWIQLFYSALNEKGQAGFVMANSASDARSSEQELRHHHRRLPAAGRLLNRRRVRETLPTHLQDELPQDREHRAAGWPPLIKKDVNVKAKMVALFSSSR